MKYIIKKEVGEVIKKKYKCLYLSKQLGVSQSYLSLLVNGKIHCPKVVAYTFSKILNENYEIEDLFERL